MQEPLTLFERIGYANDPDLSVHEQVPRTGRVQNFRLEADKAGDNHSCDPRPTSSDKKKWLMLRASAKQPVLR